MFFKHWTIIPTGITCKKISCYMHNSKCRWLIVENAKIFRIMFNIFEFFHVKEFVESWLVSWNLFHESSNHVTWARK